MNPSVVVRVPASSANLGAGFDVLGMALDLHLDIGVGDPPDDARPIDRHHPSSKAFVAVDGGDEPSPPLWVRSSIPMARGLGFSGAARVGGAALGVIAGADDPVAELDARRRDVLDVAARLEHHGDNAAASVHGGIVAWVDGRVVELRLGPRLAAARVVVWIPDVTTSTESSRRTLPELISRRDAVHNLARVTQFVAAVEHDDPLLLAGATDDRLHQTIRLGDVPGAAAALSCGVGAGAWCGWLSGSGPTVAFLVDRDAAGEVAASLPAHGQVKVLGIASGGVRVVTPPG